MALGCNKLFVLRDVDMACIKSTVYVTGMMYGVYFMFSDRASWYDSG